MPSSSVIAEAIHKRPAMRDQARERRHQPAAAALNRALAVRRQLELGRAPIGDDY